VTSVPDRASPLNVRGSACVSQTASFRFFRFRGLPAFTYADSWEAKGERGSGETV